MERLPSSLSFRPSHYHTSGQNSLLRQHSLIRRFAVPERCLIEIPQHANTVLIHEPSSNCALALPRSAALRYLCVPKNLVLIVPVKESAHADGDGCPAPAGPELGSRGLQVQEPA